MLLDLYPLLDEEEETGGGTPRRHYGQSTIQRPKPARRAVTRPFRVTVTASLDVTAPVDVPFTTTVPVTAHAVGSVMSSHGYHRDVSVPATVTTTARTFTATAATDPAVTARARTVRETDDVLLLFLLEENP